MSWKTILVLSIAVASCFGRMIYNYETDRLGNRQSGTAGRAVTGGYSWTAPNGQKFSVNYIADNQGYRIVNSQSRAQSQSFEAPRSNQAAPLSSHQHFTVPRAPAVAPRKPVVAAAPAPKFSQFKQQSSTSKNFFSTQERSALANSHFGINPSPKKSAFRALVPITPKPTTTTTTTTTTTRRPFTIIFFNTTPNPAPAQEKSVNKVVSNTGATKKAFFYHPNQFKNVNANLNPKPVAAQEAPKASPKPETAPKTEESAQSSAAEVSESSKSVDAGNSETTKTDVSTAEKSEASTKAETTAESGAEAEEAEAEGSGAGAEEAEVEGSGAGAEEAEAEGAEAEGEEAEAEGAEAEGAENENETEAEAEADGGEAEEEGPEAEEQEGFEIEYEEEEEESGSNSEADEWEW